MGWSGKGAKVMTSASPFKWRHFEGQIILHEGQGGVDVPVPIEVFTAHITESVRIDS